MRYRTSGEGGLLPSSLINVVVVGVVGVVVVVVVVLGNDKVVVFDSTILMMGREREGVAKAKVSFLHLRHQNGGTYANNSAACLQLSLSTTKKSRIS